MEANQATQIDGLLCTQLTAQAGVSSNPRPPVTYNCCVSVSPGNATIEPTTLQLIDETSTCRYSSTSATGLEERRGRETVKDKK